MALSVKWRRWTFFGDMPDLHKAIKYSPCKWLYWLRCPCGVVFTCWPSYFWRLPLCCMIQKLLGAKGGGASEFPAQDWMCQDLVSSMTLRHLSSNPTILPLEKKQHMSTREFAVSINNPLLLPLSIFTHLSPRLLPYFVSPSISFFLSLGTWSVFKSRSSRLVFVVAFLISQQWTLVESWSGAAVFHAPHRFLFRPFSSQPATERDALILQVSEKQPFCQREKRYM